jgi:hypothetical protein
MIYDAWKSERDSLLHATSKGGLDIKRSAEDSARLDVLNKSIEGYEKHGTFIYETIPKQFKIPFLMDRTGKTEGIILDSVKVFDIYGSLLSRKLNMEPAVKSSIELLKGVVPEYKGPVKWFLRSRALGMVEDSGWRQLKNAEHFFTSTTYMAKIGFNTRSVVQNLTQGINTIADIGFMPTVRGASTTLDIMRGVQSAATERGKQLWKLSGHAIEIPGLTFEAYSGMRKFQYVLSYMFARSEQFNRMTAYLGAYEKAVKMSKSDALAAAFADDVLEKTQFIY